MEKPTGKYYFAKVVLTLGTFLILHYSYDWLPNDFIALFSGIDESNYQHWKIAFYSYFLILLVEVLLTKNQDEKTQIFYSGLAATILLPWLIFILYYITAFYGPMPSVFLDVLAANIVMIISIIMAARIQYSLSLLEYSKGMKWGLMVLFVILIMQFSVFTLDSSKPWMDIFEDSYSLLMC